jgi:myo-inositol 2-dehydrogenase/D-chiro-inositol 1-dehydrogenase
VTLRVGILGAGFMGRTHGRILRGDPRVELTSVYDVDPARRTDAARELGCAAAGTERDLLAGVDAVYVTVPNTLHAAAAGRAARAGKHVFCEKPFATSLEDARALREAAEESGKVFMVGHNRRFAPVYQAVKQALEGETAATLAHFKMNRGELQSPGWVGDPEVTGGYLYETPIHLLDLARWLFGEVSRLEAGGAVRTYTELDNVSLLLGFESGLTLTFASCAHATWAFPYERVEVFGPYFTVETAEQERVSITRGLDAETTTTSFFALPMERKRGYVGIDHNFVSAVLGEEEPLVTAEDGYRSVELVDRIYRILI